MNFLKKLFNWQNIRLALIIISLIFIYGFSQVKNKKNKLVDIKIELTQPHENLLNQAMVNKLLVENFGQTKNVVKHVLDLNNLEKNLDKHPMIEKSNVYLNVKGELIAKVYDKKPLARMLWKNETRYIDKNGAIIPLSENYSARVPFISGSLQILKNEKFLELLQKIEADDFYKKSITTITVNNKSEVFLNQRSHDFEIVFGTPEDIDVKLNNFKAFYKFNEKNDKLNNYNQITLKYIKQVICSKIEKDEQ